MICNVFKDILGDGQVKTGAMRCSGADVKLTATGTRGRIKL